MLKNVTVMMVLVFLVLTGCQGKKENSSGKNETSTQGTPSEEIVTVKEEKDLTDYRKVLLHFMAQFDDRMVAFGTNDNEITISPNLKHLGKFDFDAFFKLPEKALDFIDSLMLEESDYGEEVYKKLYLLKNLKYLNIYRVSDLKDLSLLQLKLLKKLEILSIAAAPITSLDEITNCSTIKGISIFKCPVTHIPDFSQFTKIDKLIIWESNLSSLQGLETFHGQYGEVDIRDNPNLTDITALKDTNIKLLRMDEELYNNNKEWIEANIPDMNIDTTPIPQSAKPYVP
jgi:hypothetical protein